MSYLSETDTVCPSCKHPNKAEVWSILNAKDDPELKDLIIGGELNMTQCEACRHIFHVEIFLLYHDPDREILAFVYPRENLNEREKWEKKTKDDYENTLVKTSGGESLSYGPVSLFGLDDLLSFVNRDEDVQIQSDIASHISKEKGWWYDTVRPFKAREKGIPMSIPYLDKKEMSRKEAVQGALETLLVENDRLYVYREFKEKWEAHTDPAILELAKGE